MVLCQLEKRRTSQLLFEHLEIASQLTGNSKDIITSARRSQLRNTILIKIYILNGKLVSVLMHYEIDEYRKKLASSKPS